MYRSNNAPEKIDVLGSLFLSILSGHKRYSHLASLVSDGVNPALLGMNKIVSEGLQPTKAFQCSVLVTNLDDDLPSLFQHYRDRADCENNFDELKNQWGCGF